MEDVQMAEQGRVHLHRRLRPLGLGSHFWSHSYQQSHKRLVATGAVIPQLGPVVVAILPRSVQYRTRPALRETSIWNSTKLLHSIGVLQTIKRAQAINDRPAFPNGGLKRHNVKQKPKAYVHYSVLKQATQIERLDIYSNLRFPKRQVDAYRQTRMICPPQINVPASPDSSKGLHSEC